MRDGFRPNTTIQYQGHTIDYTLVHRPRVTRRVHLELGADGGLIVVAPRRMSRRAVHQSLQVGAERVARFLQTAQKRQQALPDYRYVDGETHLYLGEQLLLEITISADGRQRVTLAERALAITAREDNPEKILELLRNWYRAQAQTVYADRLKAITQQAPWTGGRIPPMRLRRMKRTWGNCSSSGLITLNPHLVKAPPELLDYVIAHEVCHLKEHNHGRRFYALQEKLFPDWRRTRQQLRADGHIYLHE